MVLVDYVDLVVHGGDLFHRSKPDPGLVQMALEPLQEVAEAGVQVALVPGNHERGRIPCPLLSRHPRLHVFHQPGTLSFDVRGQRVAVAGFPFTRRIGEGRENFHRVIEATGLHQHRGTAVRLLVMHQTVEGARVGPKDFTFRPGRDVIRGSALPQNIAAVLSGHIHRRQQLTRDLHGHVLPAPVIYPGSVERTAFAERNEPKGYMMLGIAPGSAQGSQSSGGRLIRRKFVRLPARPMLVMDLDGKSRYGDRELRRRLATLPPESVVRVNIRGLPPHKPSPFTASRLRQLCPPSMNVDLRIPGRPQTALAG